MDLSWMKWPLIIIVVVGIGWLLSAGGVDYMEGRYTKATPGDDEDKDISDEAGLSRLGGYMLATFRYQKAYGLYKKAVTRYPDGKNYWYNYYQMARCAERLEKYAEANDILHMLQDNDADSEDQRVPDNDTLRLRIQKLEGVHEL